MIFKTLSTIILLLSFSAINAQNITGRVLTPDGSPVASAKITFTNNIKPSISYQATTNADGEYAISYSDKLKSSLLSKASVDVDKLAGQMTFYFTLNQSSQIDIKLYDVSGRQPVTIYSNNCPAGNNSFSWDFTPYRNFVENKIFFISFISSDEIHTARLLMSDHSRHDFYTETIDLGDKSPAFNDSENSWTATASFSGYSDHTIRHTVLNGDQVVNFIMNKQTWVPFKCGSTYIGQYNGSNYTPFYIKGINIGAGIPGTSPAEMAPTADQYAKWFKLISEAGFNLIRVYTLHYPRFYQELEKFNKANPDKPLYIMHGAWLDEEYTGFDTNPDLYTSTVTYNPDVNAGSNLVTKTITDYFDDRIKEVVDVVHGNTSLPERWGWASGKYTADVSPWLLGYIIGREIYAIEVQKTNQNHPDISTYNGNIFKLDNCSATEAWATARLDSTLTYEQEKYNQQHPISFSSWPTLDPIDHPYETGPEDLVSVNLDKINETNAPAGYFASYHVYPYFPDFLVCEPEYRKSSDDQGENSYLGYLYDLKSHYPNRPLIISEYGVSSSWGSSRLSKNGMHHGGLTEKQQGDYIIRMMHNIKDADCGGGMLFSWIDEWFKYVWIFGQTTNAAHRNRWHNIYNAEQNYGLITFIPKEPDYTSFGYKSQSDVFEHARMASDIEGIYINIKLKQTITDKDTLWLALDTYNAGKGESLLPNNRTVNNRAEFCVEIQKNKATLYVTKAYSMYGIGQAGYPITGQYFRSIPSDKGLWTKVIWRNHRDDSFCGGNIFDASNLKIRDNNNPIRHDAVIIDNKEITVKLPWGILNFNDPSTLQVAHITDYSINGNNSEKTESSDGIAITLYKGDSKFTLPRYVWQPWDEYKMPKTTEYKKSSYYMVKQALPEFPIYLNTNQ
jgi:hypothetical protein